MIDRSPLGRQTTIVVMTVVGILLVPGVYALASYSVPVSGTVPIGTQSNLTVYAADNGGEMILRDPWINTTAVNVTTAAGNATVVDRAGNAGYLQIDTIEGSQTELSNVNVSKSVVTVRPDDKQSVRIGGDLTQLHWGDTSSVGVDDNSDDFEYASSGRATIRIGGLPANTQLVGETSDGQPVTAFTTDGSGRATITVPGTGGSLESVEILDEPTPTITDADPNDNAELLASNTTLYADINYTQFNNGDDVDVKIHLNGNVAKSVTISKNQTVEADVKPPLSQTSTWNVTATDKYDQTVKIADRTFKTPAELEIRNETDQALLDDSKLDLQVRFFSLGDQDTVVTRTANRGKINLTGLPADQRFVVTVNEDATQNYTYRRIIVDSLFNTSTIYLLNTTEPNSRIVYELQDPTGTFEPESTILYVEKPIETSPNQTEYQTIAGDVFGASARFPAVLQQDSRYRLRVETADGRNQRILGFYSVYGDTVETLKIQRIEPSGEDDTTGAVYGALEPGTGNTGTLAVRYRGGEDTSTVEYNATNSTGYEIVPNTTNTAGKFADSYQVPIDGQYTVHYTITRPDGSTVTGQFTKGSVDGVSTRLGADPQFVSIMSWIMILATMGLVVILNPRLAPAAGSGMASALTIVGTVAIPAPILGVAGAISVLTLFGGGN